MKNGIILVVTVTGRGDNPRYISGMTYLPTKGDGICHLHPTDLDFKRVRHDQVIDLRGEKEMANNDHRTFRWYLKWRFSPI